MCVCICICAYTDTDTDTDTDVCVSRYPYCPNTCGTAYDPMLDGSSVRDIPSWGMFFGSKDCRAPWPTLDTTKYMEVS